jgi:hypothetical protein
MRAVSPAGKIREQVFEFAGAGNLPNLAVGHEHKFAFRFEKQNQITERWT